MSNQLHLFCCEWGMQWRGKQPLLLLSIWTRCCSWYEGAEGCSSCRGSGGRAVCGEWQRVQWLCWLALLAKFAAADDEF
jgi:hypothetical protein